MMERFLHSMHRRRLAPILLGNIVTRTRRRTLPRSAFRMASSQEISPPIPIPPPERATEVQPPRLDERKEDRAAGNQTVSAVPVVEFRGPPDWAVQRALQNEPDAEWDAIVKKEDWKSDHSNASLDEIHESFHALVASAEGPDVDTPLTSSDVNEGTTTTVESDLAFTSSEAPLSVVPEESTSSYSPYNNLEFYDWQWKIIGTSRLIEAPMGSWTQDQWYSAENILSSGWPLQHSLRSVILQFALLRRTCQEYQSIQIIQPSPSAATPPPASTDVSLPSNPSPENSLSVVPNMTLPERGFGRKMFMRLVDNWRCVYIFHPEILRRLQLGPRDILEDAIHVYNAKYEIPMSEKVFRLILAVETHHKYNSSPEFAETILSHALDLYESGIEDGLPTTPLWNSVLLAWVLAKRRHATRQAVVRIVQLMDELKVVRSRQTYRILFRECLQRGTEEAARDAEDLLRQMYKDFLVDPTKVQPDMSTFIYVVDTWAKSNSQLAGPRAEQIYEQMKVLREKQHLLEVGDTSETRLVNCVLMCWVIMGTATAAEKAEAFWRQAGVVSDSTMYSTLISLYAKVNNLEGAERIWNELLTAVGPDGKPMNEIEFSATALLSAYSKSKLPNRVELAENILNQMKVSPNARLDTACYNGT
jgi:pentatricopeptide repeat protein